MILGICIANSMKNGCPNYNCKFYQQQKFVIKDGSYLRKDDSRKIQLFKCTDCSRRFSQSSSTLEWRQKKRRVNQILLKLLASGVSMRRAGIILGIHKTTVKRKFEYLAIKARLKNEVFLQLLEHDKVQQMQFDDLITTEHTKLKPLSISLAIDKKRRFILGAEVSIIPSFGHLAALSRKKYGKRISSHKEKLHELFEKISLTIDKSALIESDEHHYYGGVIKQFFPEADFRQYKGGRGCVSGQGELKKLHFDPLFKINHTCAMLRANINRLFRRTWCTTKRPEMLKNHLDIYIYFHNQILLPPL